MLLNPPPALEQMPGDSCDLGGLTVAGEPGRTLSLRHGAIDAIRDGEPGDDRRFEGCVATPGLIDGHQHLPPANSLALTPLFCLLYLLHGVTTVLDAGDGDGTSVAAARRLLADGAVPGPRVLACGPFIARGARDWPNSIMVEDPVAPAVVIQAAVDRGAQVIKLYDGLTREDIAALVDAARDRGLRAIGHVPAALSIEEAGVPEVQHLHGVAPPPTRRSAAMVDRLGDWRAVDDRRLDAVVGASVEQGIAHTPTLVVTEGVICAQDSSASAPLMPRMYPEVVWNRSTGLAAYRDLSPDTVAMLRDSMDKKLELVGRLHRAGAPLYLGTDVQQPYVAPGASLQREMELFAAAGIPPAQVMDIATAQAATRLGIPGLGTLTPGAPADVLIFAADPAADLDALGTLRAVVVGGRLLEVDVLRAAVARQLAHYASPLVERLSMFGARRALRRIALRA